MELIDACLRHEQTVFAVSVSVAMGPEPARGFRRPGSRAHDGTQAFRLRSPVVDSRVGGRGAGAPGARGAEKERPRRGSGA
jgi:hypothetical protein